MVLFLIFQVMWSNCGPLQGSKIKGLTDRELLLFTGYSALPYSVLKRKGHHPLSSVPGKRILEYFLRLDVILTLIKPF